MKDFNFNLSEEEVRLALRLVVSLLDEATKDEHEDEDGIFISVSDFFKFIPYEDLPLLVSLVEKYPIMPNLAQKIIDWQTDGED